MQITDSTLVLAASRQATVRRDVQESVRAWHDRPPVEGRDRETAGEATHGTRPSGDGFTPSVGLGLSRLDDGGYPRGLLRALRHAAGSWPQVQREPASAPQSAAASATAEAEPSDAADSDPHIALLKDLLYWIFRIRSERAEASRRAESGCGGCRGAEGAEPAPEVPASSSGRQGWGVEATVATSLTEIEQTTFSASGRVRTADGRLIEFTVTLSMARKSTEESVISFKAGDATVDPLVLNFAGTAAQLSDTSFAFDLQGDGTPEWVPLLGQNSGFLAFDKDGNGRITSGAELFGPQSGDGFAELAAFDADGNGWIDEADPIYGQLRVWRPDAEGPGTLVSLEAADVGAIALARVATPFSVKNGENALQGRVRSSGVFLQNSGGAGTVQQVDFAV